MNRKRYEGSVYRVGENSRWEFTTREIMLALGAMGTALIGATLWCNNVNRTLTDQGKQISSIATQVSSIETKIDRLGRYSRPMAVQP